MVNESRSEAKRKAIADSLEAGGEQEIKLSSKYVCRHEGLPDSPEVAAAIDKWANVWGKEVVILVNDEGLLDDEIPEQAVAREKLADAADELAKLLPNAKFFVGEVLFDGGFVQLSSS